MPSYEVRIVVDEPDIAQAILGFLYPDGDLTPMNIQSIEITELP